MSSITLELLDHVVEVSVSAEEVHRAMALFEPIEDDGAPIEEAPPFGVVPSPAGVPITRAA